MGGRFALFAGDVSHDLTMRIERLPEPDEKIHVSEAIDAPGGVVANAAVAAALAGARTRLLISVGDDAVGRLVTDSLRQVGPHLEEDTVEGPTCRVVSLIDTAGEKRLLLYPGASMYPSHEAVGRIALDNVGWVHTAAYGDAATDLIERSRAAGVAWSLDLEPASFEEGIDSLRGLIDGAQTVFCNQRAAVAIGDDATGHLFSLGARSVVLTLGSAGAALRTQDSETLVPAPRGLPVVDTTGGGDCLCGWFIAERLAGRKSEEALTIAVSAATLACARLGAQPSFPTRRELESAAIDKNAPSPNYLQETE